MAEAATSGVEGHDEEIVKALHADGAVAPLAGSSPRGASPRGVPVLIRAPTTTFTSANELPAPSASASRTESPTEEQKSSMSAAQEAVFRRRRLTREHMDGEIESPPVLRGATSPGRSWAAQTMADQSLKPRQSKRVSRRISREPCEKETVVWEVSHTGSTGSSRAPHRTVRHPTALRSTTYAPQQYCTAPRHTRTTPHFTTTPLHTAAQHKHSTAPHHTTAQPTAQPRDHSPRLTAPPCALG